MAAAGGSTLKDVTMELGGKSPLIVFSDAALDRGVAYQHERRSPVGVT